VVFFRKIKPVRAPALLNSVDTISFSPLRFFIVRSSLLSPRAFYADFFFFSRFSVKLTRTGLVVLVCVPWLSDAVCLLKAFAVSFFQLVPPLWGPKDSGAVSLSEFFLSI